MELVGAHFVGRPLFLLHSVIAEKKLLIWLQTVIVILYVAIVLALYYVTVAFVKLFA